MTDPIAVTFDGATRLLRSTDLTGIADGTAGSLAIWIRTPATGWPPGANQRLVCNHGDRFNLMPLAAGDIRLNCLTEAGGNLLDLRTSVLSANTSYAILYSWDTSGGTGASRVYVNDQSNAQLNTVNAGTIDYSRASWAVGATTAGTAALHYIGSVADIWVNLTTWIDFSVEANRRLFFTAGNCIVPKGTDGVVGGVTPILFFSDPIVGNWHGNKGSGGGSFVVDGNTLTEASVQPCWQTEESQTEALAPNTNLAATNLKDTAANQTVPLLLSDIQDDPDDPDANWWTAVNPTLATSARLGFPTPGSALTGLQTFRTRLRKTTGAPNPVVDIELWESGVLIDTLVSGVEITSTSGQTVTATFDAGDVTNPADVEIRIVSDPGEGFA